MKKIHPYYFVFFSVILFGLNSCASVEDYLAVDTNSANNDGIYTSSSDNGARYNVNSNSNDSYLADKYLDAVPSESYYSLDSAGIERSSIVYYDEDYVSSNNSITESSNQNSSSTNFLTSGISLGLGFGMGSMGYGGYPPMYGSPGYGYGGYPGYSYGGYPSYGFGGYPGYGYGGYPGYGGSYPGTPIYPGGENKPNIKREKRYSRTGGSNKSNYANGIKYDYSKAEREYSKKSYTKNNKSSKSNYSKYRSTNKRSNSNQYRSNNNSNSNRSYQNNSNNFNNNSAPSRSSSPSRSISPSRSSSGGSKRSR